MSSTLKWRPGNFIELMKFIGIIMQTSNDFKIDIKTNDYNGSKHLTVKELIDLLKQVPEDTLVYSAGCDCNGEAGYITYSKYKSYFDDELKTMVLIERNDNG